MNLLTSASPEKRNGSRRSTLLFHEYYGSGVIPIASHHDIQEKIFRLFDV